MNRYTPRANTSLRSLIKSTSITSNKPSHLPRPQRQASTGSGYEMSNRPRDIDEFIAGYPGQQSSSSSRPNVEFYKNERRMEPDHVLYEDWMKRNANDFEELEANHGFIQWLFPIREHGVNPRATPLQEHEIQTMSTDPAILERLLRSYKTMLAFYGIDFNGGALKPASNSSARLRDLYHCSHNLLRITRILKHLSEIEPLQPHTAPLVLYFTAQHSDGKINLSEGTFHGGSLDRWWSDVFRDANERAEVRDIVKSRGAFGAGKWGQKEFEGWYATREKTGWVGQ